MKLEDKGPIHRRLIQNKCPACEQDLQIVVKDDEKLVRKCTVCTMTVVDNVHTAEAPYNICD